MHRVLEQRLIAQSQSRTLADAGELEQQRKVELTSAQPRRHLLRLTFGEGERYVRMAVAETGDRERHQRRARRGERGDSEPDALHAGDGREILLQRLHLSEVRLCIHIEMIACLRGAVP